MLSPTVRGMQTIMPTDGRRTGATWVAATGAFLLVAAAAVFVAVRWDQLPDAGRLAVIAAVTAGFLIGGRAVRPTLPATGEVLFDLGAFLLPVNLAAVNLRLGLGWRQLLLAEAILGITALGGLGVSQDSVVLRWAGVTSVVVLAAAIAGLTPVPAPLALALLALAVDVAGGGRLRRAAVAWATVAGLAPVLASAASLLVTGAGVARELGFAGSTQLVLSLASGATAAVVLFRDAHRREDLTTAGLAIAALVCSAGIGWPSTGAGTDASLIALAAVFAVVEVGAMALRHDPFWARPVGWLAIGAEVCTVPLVFVALAAIVAAPVVFGFTDFFGTFREPMLATAAGVLAIGWYVADLRRRIGPDRDLALGLLLGSGWWGATAPLAISTVVSVELATGRAVPTAAAMVGMAALLVVSGRRYGHGIATALVVWAPLTALQSGPAGAAVTFAGVVVLAEASVIRARMGQVWSTVAAHVMAVLAVGVVFAGVHQLDVEPTFALVIASCICWLLANDLDRGGVSLGHLARLGVALPLALGTALGARDLIAPAAVVTMIYVLEALRVGDHRIGFAGACTVQLLVAAVAGASGLDAGGIGIALAVAAVVWAGMAVVVDDPSWSQPFIAAAALGAVAGLISAGGDPLAMSTVVMIDGALLVLAAVVQGSEPLGHLGGAFVLAGLVHRLSLAGVTVSEPYLMPVAAQLLVAGWLVRRRQPLSSWVAYGPAVLLAGVPAMAERFSGGPAWHAIIAGGVGIVAVGVGGWRRLGGPLVLGTGLLVLTTVYESLAVTAGVPTWAWLALGGSVLLGAGIAMERNDTTPVEAGRRLVDVFGEKFE